MILILLYQKIQLWKFFYTGGQKTSYFNNESNYSLDDMEKDSSLIARITVTNSREMSYDTTKQW